MSQTATIKREFQGSTIQTDIPLDIVEFADFVGMSVEAVAETGGIVLDGIGRLGEVFAVADSTSVPVVWEFPRSASAFLKAVPSTIRNMVVTPVMVDYEPVDKTIEALVARDTSNLPFDLKVGIAKLATLFYIDQVSDLLSSPVNDVVTRIQGGANPQEYTYSIPSVRLASWSNNLFVFEVDQEFLYTFMYRNPAYMTDTPSIGSAMSASMASGTATPSATSSMASSVAPAPQGLGMVRYTQFVGDDNEAVSDIEMGQQFYEFLGDIKTIILENAADLGVRLETVEDVIRVASDTSGDMDFIGWELLESIPENIIESIENLDSTTDHTVREARKLVETGYMRPPQVNLNFTPTYMSPEAQLATALLAVRFWGFIIAEDNPQISSIINLISQGRTTVNEQVLATRNKPLSLQSVQINPYGNVFFFRISSNYYDYEGADRFTFPTFSIPSPQAVQVSPAIESDASMSSEDSFEVPAEIMPPAASNVVPLNQDVKDPLDPDSPPFDLATVSTFPTLEDLIRTMRAMPGDTPIDIMERFPPCDYQDLDPVMFEPYAKSDKGSFVVFMLPTGDGSYKAFCISTSSFPVPSALDPSTGRMEDTPRNINYFANWVLKLFNGNINHGNGNGGRPGTRRFSKVPTPYNLYFESHVFDYIKTRSNEAISRDLLPIFWLQALPKIRMGRASNRDGNPFVGELHGQDPLETPYGIVAYGELPFSNMPDPEVD